MKVVCEMSGGADSTLATIKAQKRWRLAPLYEVFVDYGQVCVKQEKDRAQKAANKLRLCGFKIISLHNIWSGGGMIDGEQKGDLNVYTPLRNVVILSAVMAYAESIEAGIIVTGSKGFSKVANDPHSYYDSTIPFYKLMEAVWDYTTESERVLRIIPILAEGRTIKMSKIEVYRELLKRGFGFEDTWSCFRGGNKECGECHNCLIKKEVFRKIKESTE